MLCEQSAVIAPYTSWHVGGTVRYVLKPSDITVLQKWLREHPDIPTMMLGLGSNVLFPDEDSEGAVVLSRYLIQDITMQSEGCWIIDAGVSCAKLARTAALQGYKDAAFLCGIPGTIGGALAMNAGAYGGETWSFVDWVEVILRDGTIERLYPQQVQVAYRHVLLPHKAYFIRAQFTFKDHYASSQQSVIAQWLKHRAHTQPIGLPSCGSVFKNPYPQHAGALIEACGLKGYSIGGAQVSLKHANFIINTGHATAQDIKNLIKHVQATVLSQSNILLQKEVVYVSSENYITMGDMT